MWLCGQRVMWNYGWVSPHCKSPSWEFGGHRRCAREKFRLFFVTWPHVTLWSESHLTLGGEFPSSLVNTLQSLVIINLLEEEILRFQFVTWLRVTTLSDAWVLVIISHRPVKFGGHKLCGIGDIKLLICHVTPRAYVIRGSCNMGEFPSSYGTTLPSFVDIGLAEEEIFCFSLVKWPHVPTWSMNYVVLWMDASHPKSPSRSPYVNLSWKYIIYQQWLVLTCDLWF